MRTPDGARRASNVRHLSDYRPTIRFAVWQISDKPYAVWDPRQFRGHVELVQTETDAAETAARLLFDRASARRAGPPGEYVAFGARVPEASPRGYVPEEVRFLLKREP